jgi:hypothetical protein
MELLIIDQPIVLEMEAGPTLLTEILGRIASIRGRASDWGADDLVRAELLAGESTEADFPEHYYRDAFVDGASPAVLPGWTFARAGVGNSLNNNGSMSEFSTNVPRITNRGLLIERSATNLVVNSEDLSESTTLVGATLTENAVLRANGLMTGGLLTATGGGSHLGIFSATFGSGECTMSVELKSISGVFADLVFGDNATGEVAVTVNLGDGSWAGLASSGSWSAASVQAEPLSDAWWRFSVTATKGAGTSAAAIIRLPVGTASVYYGGPQVNAGRPTSYIATGGATATRGADSADVAWSTPNYGAAFVEFEAPFVPAGGTPGLISGKNTLASPLFLYDAGVGSSSDGADIVKAVSLPPGSIARAVVSWGPDGRRLTVNGAAIVSDAHDVGTWSTISLGDTQGAKLNSYIRQVVLFRRALTDAEMLEITS